jgi:TetR/AcrR family transcriptional regulator, transcriptional repressor of aconitase
MVTASYADFIALIGFSEAERDETLRATMRGFYRGFRDQLEATAARWQQAGLMGSGAWPRSAARTVLALILDHVVHAAIIGDITPADLAVGLRGIN